MMTQYALFITCPRGLETPLTDELASLNIQDIQATDGGVACKASMEQVYRINLHSRTASRVLLRLTKGSYRSEQDIYKLAKNINWFNWFTLEQTFKVKVEGKRANVKSLDFVGLKIKDALCDSFRDIYDARPSVGKIRPDVRVHAFMDERNIEIFIDTSGEALFKRGYREDTGEAPLRENLAAGLLLLAGYDGSQPFQDPFCGSGTLAIEAAWIAGRRAPGLMRRFGFEKLQNFDKAAWVKIRQEAREQIVPVTAPIAGSDNDRHMIRAAEHNAEAAEVAEFIRFEVKDAQNARPNGDNGIMISNPPYGVRLAEMQALQALYPQLGSWLKQHYAGWLIGMFTGDRDMPKFMRLSPKRKIPLYNGNLDCRLFLMDMVKGSNR
ncbi:class I SAM-dependent RNA methyltransferase [Neisseria sp. N95_16]|uniref:Class I SAM-dependent RNA methyltransferase n=1 Tax=Neisseria brasiliensis TaxID=2666100 RepID=A0A5Q3S2J5_9NEIS|nr:MULTISPECIES: class I SAM-dependent RNA methyltransferase [Neisseria]MRN37494.1 class I SAM-dependent RNA methyltransferase [Neisseria brasiliensis]PJO09663.1 class I SAM-dependent RNA methyltransferase [Neisseria sp. N95_16]PJO79399.1 class I SAM-dependent RNA methyltransferase [Neisseria sp. N177_16]QGL26410.1 class I SAM-dependent RNA methyltransferase [Neisseria brasiliensis]